MSSSYSTSNTHPGKHDVFLSFRGADTRDNFVSFLHRELVAKNGIETYIDYRLDGGKEIETTLLEKIEESLISIVIFSKNYADSIFCLRELSKILECKKRKDHIVIPVFYQVDPTDVQELRGSFVDGLSKFERECNSEEMVGWRQALTEIANLKGWDSNAIKPDTKLVESIVDDVQKKLYQMPLRDSPWSNSKSLVGIDSRIHEVESLLSIGSIDDTVILGIWGMPGIGKTTIARAVYDRISPLFDGKCFFNNVRKESQGKGVNHVRNQILLEVLEKKDLKNMSDSDIKRMLQRKKILVVLDDVSSRQQLAAALGEDCLLRQGSRIIMTSRDKQLLGNCCDSTYKVPELGFVEAFQLFKLHAFKGIQCPEGFKEPSERAVNYSNGNPLSLKVLGSNLYNKGVKEWESMLAPLKGTLDPEIQKILKMSYDRLDWKQKRIFLDVTCFFRRSPKILVQLVLDCCGFDAKCGIDRLVDLGLLSVSENDEIWMHDLIQQLGQDIVLQENIDDPRKRSRLWTAEDIDHVLTNYEGTETLQAVSLNMKEIDHINLSPTVFKGMCNLRLLEFYNPYRFCLGEEITLSFPDGLTFLPKKLRFLRWDLYPLKSLPLNFCPKYLVALRIYQSTVLEELWNRVMPLVNLEILDVVGAERLISIEKVLSYAPNLKSLSLMCCPLLTTIDLSKVPKLEVLNLSQCTLLLLTVDLSNVPNLVYLNLSSCKLIQTVDLSNVPQLKLLDLSLCESLEVIPYSIGNCTELIRLDLTCCSNLVYIPNTIGQLKCLVDLDLSHCSNLPSLPDTIGQLKCLIKLCLRGCRKLASLPNSIGSLVSLIVLDLSYCAMDSIPTSIKELPKLIALVLHNCSRLQFLPELPPGLQYIDANRCISLKSVQSIFPFTKVGNRDNEDASEYFNFSGCYQLDQNSQMKLMAEARLRIGRMATFLSKQENRPDGKLNRFMFRVPGDEVPEWFGYRNKGSSLRIKVPSNHYGSGSGEFLGFALGAVVEREDSLLPDIWCECHLITEDGGTCDLRFPYFEGSDDPHPSWESENVFIWYDWSSSTSINHSNHFLNEASFNFYAKKENYSHERADLEVINCGVHLLFARDCERAITSSSSFECILLPLQTHWQDVSFDLPSFTIETIYLERQ